MSRARRRRRAMAWFRYERCCYGVTYRFYGPIHAGRARALDAEGTRPIKIN
jgi:hypothetical protein